MRRPWKVVIGAVLSALTIGGGVAIWNINVVEPDPPSDLVGAVFIDKTTGDNSCQRLNPPGVYDSTKACSTFVTACAITQSGDTVYFKSGSYAGEQVFRAAGGGQPTNCDFTSPTIFAVPESETVEFTGRWGFGDLNTGASGAAGPRNLKLVNWNMKDSESNFEAWEVQGMHIDGGDFQQFDWGGIHSPPSDQNGIIENSEFHGCFGTFGSTQIACITRIDASGVTVRNNDYFDYHSGEYYPGCISGGTNTSTACPRGVGILMRCTTSGGFQDDTIVENNRFWNIGLASIRVQPSGGCVFSDAIFRNNWFGCGDPGNPVNENGNGSFALDNSLSITGIKIYGNTMCSGIGGLDVFESGDPEQWGTGSEFRGNIIVQGGFDTVTVPAPRCASANLTSRYNLRLPVETGDDFDGEYKCHSTDILMPYDADKLDDYVVGPTWGQNMDLHLKSSVTTADDAWPDSDCVLLASDFDNESRSSDAGCEIGSDEKPPAPPAVATCSSVTQYTITWAFSSERPCGQYVNGDWWVQAPVTINSITPSFDGNNNGWEVNPVVAGSHGFDPQCYGNTYSASLVPSLPYVAAAGQSIVKAVSSGITGRGCLQTAAVLTVVASPPANNGATVFRPPYVGTIKPNISTDELRTDLLPTFAPVAAAPTLSTVEQEFTRVWLDHKGGQTGRGLHPLDNMEDYGADIATDINEGILRLMLNDSLETKMPALVKVAQTGIDQYYMFNNGQTWPDGDGVRPGHRLILAFAATILDKPDWKTALNASNVFHEDKAIIVQNFSGQWLWGSQPNEASYWITVQTDTGFRQRVDPYAYVDGGTAAGNPYLLCCTAQPWKGEILASYLMSSLTSAWNPTEYAQTSNLVDRWVTQGSIIDPDPCAPLSQGGGANGSGGCILDPDLETYTNATTFTCKAGFDCGRFIIGTGQGGEPDSGNRKSTFVKNMWDAYR